MSNTGWTPVAEPSQASGWTPVQSASTAQASTPSPSSAQSWWQRLTSFLGEPEDTSATFPKRGDNLDPKQVMKQGISAQMDYMKQGYGQALPIAATAAAPEIAPEAGIAARAALTAGLAGAGTSAGQAIQGQNPLASQQLKDAGTNAALAGVSDFTIGALAKGWGSKLARGMVNESAGATGRDVIYGNPAKALLNEGITTPFTGDLEAYKDALRAGASSQDAYQAAGGRIAAVSAKISQLSPQIDALLSKSTAQIPVADVIDKPLMDAVSEIAGNRAMTQVEKDAAIGQLGALQQSLKQGLGDTITPLQANQIKQMIGNRINWAGNIAVTDEVKPAYRAVYGSLKQAVNNSVPEVAPINERLTNLLAAQTDLHKLMQAEEVGQGKGALGSAVTGIARRAEAVAGRAIPGASSFTDTLRSFVPTSMVGLRSLLSPGGGDRP